MSQRRLSPHLDLSPLKHHVLSTPAQRPGVLVMWFARPLNPDARKAAIQCLRDHRMTDTLDPEAEASVRRVLGLETHALEAQQAMAVRWFPPTRESQAQHHAALRALNEDWGLARLWVRYTSTFTRLNDDGSITWSAGEPPSLDALPHLDTIDPASWASSLASTQALNLEFTFDTPLTAAQTHIVRAYHQLWSQTFLDHQRLDAIESAPASTAEPSPWAHGGSSCTPVDHAPNQCIWSIRDVLLPDDMLPRVTSHLLWVLAGLHDVVPISNITAHRVDDAAAADAHGCSTHTHPTPDWELRVSRAQHCLEQGDFKSLGRSLFGLHGDHAVTLLVGLALSHTPSLDDALRLADMAIHRASGNYDAHMLKLDVLHAMGRWDDALAFAAEHAPSNVRVLLRYLELQLRTEDVTIDTTRAQVAALAADHDVFHPASLLCERATQLIEQGDATLALALYQEATTFPDSSVDAFVEGGRAAHRSGAFEDMAALTWRGLARWPQEPGLWTHLLVALRAIGDVDRLDEALEQACAEATKDPVLLENCLAVLDERGRSADAVRLLDAFLAHTPHMPPSLMPNALMVLTREGQTARVDHLLDAARDALAPAVFAHLAACVWTLRGELDTARECVERAQALGADKTVLTSDPDLAPLWGDG